jgi:hypothetical protein
MSGRGDTYDQMMFIITLNSILGSVGAGLIFRVFTAKELTRRLDVIIAVILGWLVWTFVYIMVARSILLSPSKTWSTFVKRLVVNTTYVVTVFAYLYLDDFVRTATLASGMSVAEALVYVFGGIMLLSALQSLFEYYAVFELTRPDRAKPE